MGMTCETWSCDTCARFPPQNLLVTIEMTQSEEFHRYIQHLHTCNQIARSIIDEAHLALTHDSFRSVMKTLQWIGGQNCQVILQTATLPPTLVPELCKRFGLTAYEECRSQTARPNISFRVERYTPGELDATLWRCFNEALGVSAESKTLIFCLSREDACATAKLLEIPVCHSGLDKDTVEMILKDFRGSGRAIATTSLLGVALDIPGVTHVLHRNYPRDAVSFSQETGRAGRDSLYSRAWSVVIVPAQRSLPRKTEVDRFGAKLMHASLDDTQHCRRLMVQTFIDGCAVPCSMLEGFTHLCDVCSLEYNVRPARGHDYSFPKDLINGYIPSW
jgi:superfamily II DNA helicase RecQ